MTIREMALTNHLGMTVRVRIVSDGVLIQQLICDGAVTYESEPLHYDSQTHDYAQILSELAYDTIYASQLMGDK